jgi:hypothetical protein
VLLYLEVKLKNELTSTLDSSVAHLFMKKRVKQKRAWNEKQFIISHENQVAKGRPIKVNRTYKLGRKFIKVACCNKSNGKKGSSPRGKSETKSGTKDNRQKRLLKSQQQKKPAKRQVAPGRRRQAMPNDTF